MITNINEFKINENATQMLTLWHGGNLDGDYEHSKSKTSTSYAYGPGLYLTTNYDVAIKYAKGSRKLYKITITKGVDLNEALLSLESIEGFIKSFVIGHKKKEITERISKYINDGKVKAYLFNNILLNEEAVQVSKLRELRQFYIDNGIDYETVINAFGWGETMIVLYNMTKIVDQSIMRPTEKIEVFNLPNDFH